VNRDEEPAEPHPLRGDSLEQLRDRVQSGAYQVDPEAVAEAIVANPAWRASLSSAADGAGARRQCS
jgi:hypothetical protein